MSSTNPNASSRHPHVAGAFYPSTRAKCDELLAKCIPTSEVLGEQSGSVVSAVVPHAGWIFSGPTAGLVFRAIQERGGADTFVLFGAVHVWGVDQPSLYPNGAWSTPAGDVEIDEELARAIAVESEGLIAEDAAAHTQEHSLEVQVPFIKHLFPEARIVPIMVPPIAEAARVGHRVARSVAKRPGGRKVVAIGSSDLTHYGPNYRFMPVGLGPQSLDWVKKDNDKRILDMAVSMREEEIVGEALSHQNACGPGAIAAACGFAREAGATSGRLLGYTTSYDVMPERQPSSFVGYGAVVYEAAG